MNRCVIFGGGEIADIRYTQNLLQKGDYIICADSGYAYLQSKKPSDGDIRKF